MEETFLFLDTETTGWRKSGAKVQKGQARVCQVAMILADSEGKSIIEFSSLLKPDDWKISDGANECHGITDEQCDNYGIHQSLMMHTFSHMADRADKVVAHHVNFDKAMMDIEAAHLSKTENPATRKPWYCTQEQSKNLCKIPPTAKMLAAGRTHYKTPSLEEAYFHFTGKQIENAHDAMADTKACMEIFFAMRGIKL